MALRHWAIIIAPMHMVTIDADELQQHQQVLTFLRDGKTIAQFHQYMGWCESFLEERQLPARESASVLSLVPTPDRPKETPDAPSPA